MGKSLPQAVYMRRPGTTELEITSPQGPHSLLLKESGPKIENRYGLLALRPYKNKVSRPSGSIIRFGSVTWRPAGQNRHLAQEQRTRSGQHFWQQMEKLNAMSRYLVV